MTSVSEASRRTGIFAGEDPYALARDWLAEGVIKQHRTFATYVNTLVDLGFAISRVIEWGPTDEQLAANPSLAEERDRPTFMLVRADLPRR